MSILATARSLGVTITGRWDREAPIPHVRVITDHLLSNGRVYTYPVHETLRAPAIVYTLTGSTTYGRADVAAQFPGNPIVVYGILHVTRVIYPATLISGGTA